MVVRAPRPNCSSLALLFFMFALSAAAAEYPSPKENDWIARDFKFHSGEVVPALRQHYTTIGSPSGQPVLILHGTTGSGTSMLTSGFAGECLGPAKPWMRQNTSSSFPTHWAPGNRPSRQTVCGRNSRSPTPDDMVLAQSRLITEGLGIRHLRLVIGNSMGGMHTWVWGVTYPDFMDALVPMASQPTEMSARNWMIRRMLIDAVRKDPLWDNGNFAREPEAFALMRKGLRRRATAPTRIGAQRACVRGGARGA